MSQSTDAILFYGYCWDDEMTAPWPEGEPEEATWEWEDRLARLKGVSGYAETSKLKKESPCLAGTHCHSECPMPYVAIKESEVTAWRGSPMEIDSGHLAVREDWDRQLAEFCQLLGINVSNKKPGWFLVSNWS